MAGGLGRRLRGDLYLAYRAALVHPLKRLLSRREESGLERFIENYAPEGLIPTSPTDAQVLQGASRCIHCGLCDAFDLTLASAPRQHQDGASLLPLQYARATPDLAHARRALEAIGVAGGDVASASDASLARLEAVCPTRVPLRELARYLRGKLGELERTSS